MRWTPALLAAVLSAPGLLPAGEGPPKDERDAVRTEVHDVVSLTRGGTAEYVAYLRDREGARLLPIVISGGQALSIATGLRKEPYPRPLTHDLFHAFLKETGTKLVSVLIDELRPLSGSSPRGTYFAVLSLERADGSAFDLDARPSDAMALAVRTATPIFVSRKILDANAFPENGPEKPVPEGEGPPDAYY